MSYYSDLAARFGVPYRTFWGNVQHYGLERTIRMYETGENMRSNARVYRGKTMSEWAREIGIHPNAMRYRVRTWGWVKAVAKPGRAK